MGAVNFAAILEAAGLPEPVEEFRFDLHRKWRFDFAWPERMLALEIEGGVWSGGRHVRGKGYENDCVKYSEAAVLGWRIIRVTTAMVKDGRALDYIQRALRG